MTIFKTIYRSIFGKDYSSVWRQFAKESNGTYLPGGEQKVEFPYKDHKIIFDTYTHYTNVGGSSRESEYVRAMVEFQSPDSLKLILIPQDLIETIAKLFGAQDIVIGDKAFDKKFMIKGNDEYKAQLILSNSSIKKALMELEFVRLEISNEEGLFGEKVNEGNYMLYYVSEEKITHIDQLNKMYRLFGDMLDVLTKVSSIKVKRLHHEK